MLFKLFNLLFVLYILKFLRQLIIHFRLKLAYYFKKKDRKWEHVHARNLLVGGIVDKIG